MNSALTLGMRDLDWLEQNSEPAAQGDLDLVADAYKSYIRTLTDMVEVGRHRGDQRKLEQRGKMARLMADTLRQQLTTNIAHRRLQTSQYLLEAKRFNQKLKVAGLSVFGLDCMLLVLCSAVCSATSDGWSGRPPRAVTGRCTTRSPACLTGSC